MAKGGLGAGLSSILGEGAQLEHRPADCVYLPISKVETNPEQPRKHFDKEALQDLAHSIREHGVIQPLTVRRLDTGYYQIIAGERRWRAARQAGIRELPCLIVTADDLRVTELALIENLQREDLNPLEEAMGYSQLIEEFGLTQEKAAERVGKSRPAVANALRLLALDKEIQDLLVRGDVSAGHARAILKLPTNEGQIALAKRVVADRLSVRQTEQLADKLCTEKSETKEKANPFVDYTREVENKLTERLGRKVKIVAGKKRGRVELDYYDSDDLEVVISALQTLQIGRGKEA